MNSPNIIRTGGFAALAGGALLLSAGAWIAIQMYAAGGPEQYFSEVKYSEQVTTAVYAGQMGMGLLGSMLLLIALVGLHARQAKAAGSLGLVGFLAALVGAGLGVSIYWVEFFINPSLGIGAPEFLDGEIPGPARLGLVRSGVAQTVGWLLFGAATFRARIFPRAAAVGLMIGVLLTFAALPGLSYVLFGAAVIWLGLSALREERGSSSEAVAVEAQPQAR